MYKLTANKVTGIILLALTLVSCIYNKKEDSVDLVDQLSTLDRQLDEAFFEQDVEFMSRVLAEDFTWIHSGVVQIDSKATTLELIASYPVSLEREAIDVRIYNDTALISGFLSVRDKSNTLIGKFHAQRTYVRTKGEEWKLVYQHVTTDSGTVNRPSES